MKVQGDWNRVMRSGVRGILALLGALVPAILWSIASGSAAAQPRGKNILFLFSSVKYSEDFLDTVEPVIRARVPGSITFYDAYLDDPQIAGESYRESMAQALRDRYAGVKMDVVVANNPAALDFAVEYRRRIFPGVPIVFIGIGRPEELRKGPGITGVLSPMGVRETVDLALRLQPDTNAVAVVAGVTNWDALQLAYLHSALLRYQERVKEIDVIGPPSRQQLERVARLPPHTVVFFQTYPQFSNQEEFGTWDLLSAVAKAAPTYSVFERLCLSGCIGGAFYDYRKEWLSTAEMVVRVLNGERPDDIPVVHSTALQAQVDWRALQHWHIPESALPVGSVILNRPPSFWEQYRWYVIAAVVVIVVLLLLIAGLLWERARKRKAEAVLRESEKRFRVMADTTPSLVWMCNPKGEITYLNERRVEFIGPDPQAGYGGSWVEYVHPDDRRNVQDVISQALNDGRAFSNEYRLRRSDGAYRWMFDVASPRLNGDGSFAGFIGSAIDVTDQKLAQQALEKLSRQLIEAQEKERRRIARDLHDDICQRLALLSMELDQANRSVNEPADETKRRLKEIQQHCSEIAGDVQSLSHELHSARLDYLGIAAAIRGFCHEFSKQHEVSIEFTERDVPADLPREISLCLFRVAQEALHNAAKYSGVSRYAVELNATAEQIQLVVSDCGRGFDVEAAKGNRGLGLVSMQERVHLVHGSFHVESQPGKGTKIVALVPLVSGRQKYPEDDGIEEPKGVAGPA